MRSDLELLSLIFENDEQAFNELIERYNSKINIIISKYKNKAMQVGLDISDLYQEGLIGLISAIKTYDDSKKTSFSTFASLAIERELMDLVKINDRMRSKSLNEAISLDNYDDDTNLYDVLGTTSSVEQDLISEEDKALVIKSLTPFELKIYELKLDGKKNTEIANILDKDQRSIINAVQRIKQKISNIVMN